MNLFVVSTKTLSNVPSIMIFYDILYLKLWHEVVAIKEH